MQELFRRELLQDFFGLTVEHADDELARAWVDGHRKFLVWSQDLKPVELCDRLHHCASVARRGGSVRNGLRRPPGDIGNARYYVALGVDPVVRLLLHIGSIRKDSTAFLTSLQCENLMIAMRRQGRGME